MGFLIDEQRMVDDNTFMFEERIKSPTTRFIDGSPTFVTYYHINNNETTVDGGFNDVHSTIGKNSPIRFNKIEKLPIYGLDQIVLQLQDEEYGISTTYENDAIILPNTLKPLPNDLFIIPILDDIYLFKVTNITYDTIMADNFYKIEFSLDSIDSNIVHDINTYQVIEENVCILENIGTESKCIIEKNSFIKIKEVQKLYKSITDFYKAMFYNEKHNVFLGFNKNDRFIYDALQTEFINKHNLFNEKKDMEVLYLTDEYEDSKRKYKYTKSIYRLIELRDTRLISVFPYTLIPGISMIETSFAKWYDHKVDIMEYELSSNFNLNYNLLSEDFVKAVEYNLDIDGNYANFIKKYIRNEELKINDIPKNLDDELIHLNNSFEVFLFTPIILYIIRDIIKKELNE